MAKLALALAPFALMVATLCLISSADTVNGLRDGDIYKFTSVLDDKVLTITSAEAESGTNVTLEVWQDQTNQKFLAVEAVVAGDNYLLMAKRQKWDWNRFVSRGGGTLKDRHNDLPDWSLVLSVDTKSGSNSVTQQFRDSKTYQQWRSIRIESTATHLLKNVASELCLRNPGVEQETKPKTGFFQRIKQQASQVLRGSSSSSSSSSNNSDKDKQPHFPIAVLVTCDRTDKNQQWTLDVVS